MRCAAAGDPDPVQPSDRLAPGVSVGQPGVGLHRLRQLPADGIQRVQCRQRVLENCANPAPADASQRFRRQVVDPFPLQQDFTAGDAPRSLQQTDDRYPGQ